MKGRDIILLICILLPIRLSGQNKFIPPDPYTHWDGITHWSKYLITSPGYFGPNALPVPAVHKARVDDKVFWSGRYEYYLGTGDETHDLQTQLVVPFAKGRVGLEFRYVPFEFFSMDSSVSRLRRTESGRAVSGSAFGDVYFGTTIQVLKDHGHLPDLTVSMTCRTASGTGRENARTTDTPGYYFDAAIGDQYGPEKGFFRHVRWYAEAGFYVWQTYLDNYPQDDALLYGAGIDLDFKDFFISQSLGGYDGYMHNGDRPVVYRIDLGIRMGQAAWVFGYEKGLRDFPYQAIRAGVQVSGFKSDTSTRQ